MTLFKKINGDLVIKVTSNISPITRPRYNNKPKPISGFAQI